MKKRQLNVLSLFAVVSFAAVSFVFINAGTDYLSARHYHGVEMMTTQEAIDLALQYPKINLTVIGDTPILEVAYDFETKDELDLLYDPSAPADPFSIFPFVMGGAFAFLAIYACVKFGGLFIKDEEEDDGK